MGAKAWFVAYFDDDPKTTLENGPSLDRRASLKLANQLFPSSSITENDDGALIYLDPDENQLFVGCYPGLTIVAHKELSGDYPSKIGARWLDPTLGRNMYLHATHSVSDWTAFGIWRDGQLIRSLSVSLGRGIEEAIGSPLPFEKPFWAGKFPPVALDTLFLEGISFEVSRFEGKLPFAADDNDDTAQLPFHPLALSESSMLEHLGFQFEGNEVDMVFDPSEVPIVRFSVENNHSIGNFSESEPRLH